METPKIEKPEEEDEPKTEEHGVEEPEESGEDCGAKTTKKEEKNTPQFNKIEVEIKNKLTDIKTFNTKDLSLAIFWIIMIFVLASIFSLNVKLDAIDRNNL